MLNLAAGPVSRILFPPLRAGDGHSSRRHITGPLQRPTRKLWRTEPARAPQRTLLPYLVLLRVGFSLPPPSLGARCALTAPFHPYLEQPPQQTHTTLIVALRSPRWLLEAVSFLWHFPSTALERRRPDVIRHTALWSSDFPLPCRAAWTEVHRPRPGSDHPAQQLTG